MRRINQYGVTLLEMMLVLVIASAIILMMIGYTTQRFEEQRRDKAALQMQMVLNAALAYYTNNSVWPQKGAGYLDDSELVKQNYVPKGIKNPWGFPLRAGSTSLTGANFYVTSMTGKGTNATSNAALIAGRLPFGMVTIWSEYNKLQRGNLPTPQDCSGEDCYPVASVTIPGQNLNNARSVNFGSLYRSGACVPVPTCPGTMKPQIFVVPASVSGVFDKPNCSDPNDWQSCNPPASVLPVNSYTAFATGPSATATPPSCQPSSTASIPCKGPGTFLSDVSYWRVCLSVVSEKGLVKPTTMAWGQLLGTVFVVTKCVPTNEPSGANFVVYDER